MTYSTAEQPGSSQWRVEQAARLLAFGRGSELPTGGFGWLAADGAVDVTMPRPLFIVARMSYVYALAFAETGSDEFRRLAISGLNCMLSQYRDREHGGWYASLDRHGAVSDSTKANYAHAHVVLASATALAAGVPVAADVLEHATAAVDDHFWSDDEGAAVEDWDAAFGTLEPYRGANSNMHSLEAYLVAGDVTRDARWHGRALAIAEKLINGHARASDWRVPEHYSESWQPLFDYNRDHPDDRFRPFGTTPGHSFEWARLLLTLQASLSDPPGWLVESAIGLFDAAVTHGWAPDGHPGFGYTLDYDDRPVVSKRLHWVVCEAVLAAHALHRHTSEDRYERLADLWWQHIDEHFLDAGGGWWQELDPSLRPTTTIWTGKPDVYHSYQALLLPNLPSAPCAAVVLARGTGEPG